MADILHGSARATPQVRSEIQASKSTLTVKANNVSDEVAALPGADKGAVGQ